MGERRAFLRARSRNAHPAAHALPTRTALQGVCRGLGQAQGAARGRAFDTVLRALETQQKRQPVDWVFCYTYNSLVPHSVLMKSIEKFWTKVMPRFR